MLVFEIGIGHSIGCVFHVMKDIVQYRDAQHFFLCIVVFG